MFAPSAVFLSLKYLLKNVGGSKGGCRTTGEDPGQIGRLRLLGQMGASVRRLLRHQLQQLPLVDLAHCIAWHGRQPMPTLWNLHGGRQQHSTHANAAVAWCYVAIPSCAMALLPGHINCSCSALVLVQGQPAPVDAASLRCMPYQSQTAVDRAQPNACSCYPQP